MSKCLNVILDTNIFVKGIFFKATNPYCAKIMRLLELNQFKIVFAQDTFGELVWLMKNTALFKLKTEEERLNVLNDIMELFYYAITVNTSKTEAPKCDDKEDDMFLKAIVESNGDYIVSDDYNSGMHKIVDDRFIVVDSKGFIDIIFENRKNRVEEKVAIGQD